MFYLVCHKHNVIHGPKGVATLTEKEMVLFLLLINNEKDINAIINYIWKERAGVVNQNTLSQLAFRLRSKLQKAFIPFSFSLSLSKGVKCNKSRWCVFIIAKNKIITDVLINTFEILYFHAWRVMQKDLDDKEPPMNIAGK